MTTQHYATWADAFTDTTRGYHHPHFVRAETTPAGGIDFEFSPFDGTEPEPAMPEVPTDTIPHGSPDREFLVRMYRAARERWEEARTVVTEPETCARYLTLAGQVLADRALTTDVIDRGTEWEPRSYTWECRGCPGLGDGFQYLADAERDANAHAEACRGIPVP
ncbi:hypothetical protein FNQ90_23425 [Streptomyces alkaliphilus]|uniref:Uncharacterized protein n=1 Tax=Streptomyces alkaliphilus TaxID=1472722 RepID=A0A7W3THQ1_9ACTN|nr:hypothetical protein [Streptomyces alkaliphilus]MBB0246992.1 hypothetical protein [Streptomyces alkaliphilus]